MNEEDTIAGGRDGPTPLDQEQAAADLDQSVADREQALADVDQAAIERNQADLADERESANPGDFASSVKFTQRQADLDYCQARSDARQDQIDQAQAGGDQRQELLDDQQRARERPRASAPLSARVLEAETQVRGRDAARRAKNARHRAQQALRRAEAAELRAQALLGRR
ncbi:MAG: hypothetical protein JW895_07220 [Thermoleophilaceae bacterium]|nr:hypothetical protein [Thermoleophilaceae bacterium]